MYTVSPGVYRAWAVKRLLHGTQLVNRFESKDSITRIVSQYRIGTAEARWGWRGSASHTCVMSDD